jgi:VWFA-related protein
MCLAVQPQAADQTRGQDTPTFRASVGLTRLDVSVLDKNNLPVRGLTQADFTIREDKQPKELQTFLAVDLPEAKAGAPSWVRDVASDVTTNTGVEAERLVVMVIDDIMASDPFAARSAKEIGRQAIEPISATDLVAVTYMGRAERGQEFTHDRARLLAAVERFVTAGPGRFGPTLLDAAGWDRYVKALWALRDLVETLGNVPERRKAVLWITPGFGTDPGSPQEYAWKAILRAAQVANVNLYLIDPSGLQMPNPGDKNFNSALGNIRDNHNMLLATASNTGGHAFVDSNEFKSKLTQVFRETGAFYLLGYVSPTAPEDGKFHRIEVKVNRPGVTVHFRDGYYDPNPADPKRAAPLPMEVAGLVPKREVGIAIVATALKGGGVNQPVAVALTVTPPSPRDGPVETDIVLEAWLPSDGTRKASTRVRVTVPASQAGQAVLASLSLPSGRYQLRANATSATRKSGTVYADLDVPDFVKDEILFSNVVIGTTHAPTGVGADPLEGLLPIVPNTCRSFSAADRVMAFLQISQGGLQPPTAVALTTRILDEKGVAVSTATETLGAERFREKRTLGHQFTLPSSALRSGKYLLTFEATLGKTTARRDVVLELR